MMRPIFVWSVFHLPEVDSTSDHARRLLAAGPVETPGLVTSDRQTRGRGQRSNAWWSDAGSLTATLILDPAPLGIRPDREPRVALTTAVAVVDAIGDLYAGCRPGIRWPNDVEVDGRKLGGILPERVETADGPRLLIGIGLNVRTRVDDAPADVRRLAASLVEWDRNPSVANPKAELLDAIVAHLPGRLRELAEDDEALPLRWARLDTLFGAAVRIEVGRDMIEGVGAGIDREGAVRVASRGGIHVLHAGRVLRD